MNVLILFGSTKYLNELFIRDRAAAASRLPSFKRMIAIDEMIDLLYH